MHLPDPRHPPTARSLACRRVRTRALSRQRTGMLTRQRTSIRLGSGGVGGGGEGDETGFVATTVESFRRMLGAKLLQKGEGGHVSTTQQLEAWACRQPSPPPLSKSLSAPLPHFVLTRFHAHSCCTTRPSWSTHGTVVQTGPSTRLSSAWLCARCAFSMLACPPALRSTIASHYAHEHLPLPQISASQCFSSPVSMPLPDASVQCSSPTLQPRSQLMSFSPMLQPNASAQISVHELQPNAPAQRSSPDFSP